MIRHAKARNTLSSPRLLHLDPFINGLDQPQWMKTMYESALAVTNSDDLPGFHEFGGVSHWQRFRYL